MTCSICTYATQHGSWPPSHRGTHCDGCHRSWAGLREAHCVECHAHFSADSIADKHRKGYVCLTADEMRQTVSKAGNPVFREVMTPNGVLWRSAETLRLSPAFLANAGRDG